MPRLEPEPPHPPIPPGTPLDQQAHQPDPRQRSHARRGEDFLIAAMAGALAWVITLALRSAFSG